MPNLANAPGLISRLLSPRFFIILPVLLLLAAACSEDPIISDEQEPGGPQFSAIIVTGDLAVGRNRIVFGIIDREGMPVTGESAEVEVHLLVDGEETREVKDSATAEFVPWPIAVRGVFSAEVDLDVAGFYEIDVVSTSSDGTPIFAQASFNLKETSSTPAIGAPAPASVTHTGAEVDDLSHITSSPEPDPDLYEISIHEALQQDKPLVIVFATPAFCVSATCGPQVGELTKVKEKLGDQVNYIHVEVFENPHLLEGGRPSGDLVAAVEEWGLPTEPWTFIVDRDGLIYDKFEQFTTAEQLEEALQEIL
ncbi:MAG: hypothetical protein O2913_04860 [Chloroflexi bacterium]|nr:hypothetical protein [Chloroflexota bacterium]